MNTMAPVRPAELQCRLVPLAAGPTAAAEARSQVQTAVRTWEVPVDLDAAALLTSELVTNAVQHEETGTITVAITCSPARLRVDVHDTARSLPVIVEAPGDAETGRGLKLVAALSAEWGYYRTPAGKAVYFTLPFQPDLSPASSGSGPRGF
jgi:anti-sigma regulatory factor (Ser/Thr protein kinase)